VKLLARLSPLDALLVSMLLAVHAVLGVVFFYA